MSSTLVGWETCSEEDGPSHRGRPRAFHPFVPRTSQSANRAEDEGDVRAAERARLKAERKAERSRIRAARQAKRARRAQRKAAEGKRPVAIEIPAISAAMETDDDVIEDAVEVKKDEGGCGGSSDHRHDTGLAQPDVVMQPRSDDSRGTFEDHLDTHAATVGSPEPASDAAMRPSAEAWERLVAAAREFGEQEACPVLLLAPTQSPMLAYASEPIIRAFVEDPVVQARLRAFCPQTTTLFAPA